MSGLKCSLMHCRALMLLEYMKVRYSSLIIHIDEEVWEAAEEVDWRWDSALLPSYLKVQLCI